MERSFIAKSVWRIISLAAAATVLLCFFLPWIEVGFKHLNTSLTGYQIATGSGPMGLNIHSWKSLMLIPTSMIFAIVMTIPSLFGFVPEGQAIRIISLLVMVAGLTSLGAIMYQYFDLNDETNKTLWGMLAQNIISHAAGWTISLFGSIAVILAGLLDVVFSSPAKLRRIEAVEITDL